MKIQKVLLIYKKSAFAIYHRTINSTSPMNRNEIVSAKIQRMIDAHAEHYETLSCVEKTLKEFHLAYTKRLRKKIPDFSPYDLIVTVGGDGTFLEAARELKNHFILGINSAPGYSVGKLCNTTRKNFKLILSRIISGDFETKFLQRLNVQSVNPKFSSECLNEILICDENPSVMSRYHLSINNYGEEQHGSGIWIATPSGSTGAIKSAGGKMIKDPGEKSFQYLPRELYKGINKNYQLSGGILHESDKVTIVSFMRNGKIYVDGNHCCLPFPYGAQIEVMLSRNPIKTIKFNSKKK